MEDKIWQGFLYDFYGELFNERQKSVYECYIIEDMSLAEIAEEQGISRQGVHDVIKRCNEKLKMYEDKLHLVDKFMHIRDDVSKINELAKEATEDNLSKICEISNDILEEL